MRYVIGDITSPPCGAIAHQCNCVSRGVNAAKGVAQAIFQKFPYADLYALRGRNPDAYPEPGAVHIAMPPDKTRFNIHSPEQPLVFNLLGQHKPGKPKQFGFDSPETRARWMKQCLSIVGSEVRVLGIPEIAFPYGMGSGLAGGEWSVYRRLLIDFESNGTAVTLMVLPQFQHLIASDMEQLEREGLSSSIT